MNLLLRNYLHYNLYDLVRVVEVCWKAVTHFPSSQADKLVSNSTFPASANNSEMARFLYYLGRLCPLTSLPLSVLALSTHVSSLVPGRIKAIQLDYSEAYKHLVQVSPCLALSLGRP